MVSCVNTYLSVSQYGQQCNLEAVHILTALLLLTKYVYNNPLVCSEL